MNIAPLRMRRKLASIARAIVIWNHRRGVCVVVAVVKHSRTEFLNPERTCRFEPVWNCENDESGVNKLWLLSKALISLRRFFTPGCRCAHTGNDEVQIRDDNRLLPIGWVSYTLQFDAYSELTAPSGDRWNLLIVLWSIIFRFVHAMLIPTSASKGSYMSLAKK